jgi:hypothetical protein
MGIVPSLQSPKLTPADAFTKRWLCNPALGLASPERAFKQPEGNPKPPRRGPLLAPSSTVLGQFRAPRSQLLLSSVEGVILTVTFQLSLLPGVQPFPFKSTSDLAAFYSLHVTPRVRNITWPGTRRERRSTKGRAKSADQQQATHREYRSIPTARKCAVPCNETPTSQESQPPWKGTGHRNLVFNAGRRIPNLCERGGR